MDDFVSLFEQRGRRMLALSRLGRMTLDALAFVNDDVESVFDDHFKFMAEHIDEYHQSHPRIDIPEYRVVAFVDGLTLIATISEVESYFQDLVAIVLKKHPKKIGNSTLDLNALQKFDSISDAVAYAARDYAANLMFESPKAYKKKILSILSAPDDLLERHWATFIEAKARRDIGVHNEWIVNDVYNSKVREVGLSPKPIGPLVVDTNYMNSVRNSCLSMMEDLARHSQSKFL